MLVSAVQQRHSVIHIYPLFFGLPSHRGHHPALSRAPCAVQRLSSVICFAHSSAHMSACLPVHHTALPCTAIRSTINLRPICWSGAFGTFFLYFLVKRVWSWKSKDQGSSFSYAINSLMILSANLPIFTEGPPSTPGSNTTVSVVSVLRWNSLTEN